MYALEEGIGIVVREMLSLKKGKKKSNKTNIKEIRRKMMF